MVLVYIMYICVMINYQVVSSPIIDYRREFRYAYVWLRPRVVIDARYLRLTTSRSAVLYGIKVMTYKLIALNSNIDVTADEVSRHIGFKISSAVRDNGILSPVYQSDVEDVVRSCFNSDDDRSVNIFTNNKIEWKKDIKGLIKLTKEEVDFLSSISMENRVNEKIKMIGDKKLRYTNKIMSEAKREDAIDKMECAIEALKSVRMGEFITRGDIADVSGVSYNTVCRYLDKGYIVDDSILDARTEKSFEVNKRLEDGCVNIHSKGYKITKSKLHKESRVSRPTIDKKLKDKSVRLSEYIYKLNSKL